MKTPDYNLLPEHLRKGMQNYVEHGILPKSGSFLYRLLVNDFVGSIVGAVFYEADDINLDLCILYKIAGFLVTQLPSTIWGSPDTVLTYSKMKLEK